MEQMKEQLKDYIKIEEAAKKWNISIRRVQALCAGGKIPGAVHLGRQWLLPKDVQKPADGRTKASRSIQQQTALELPLPRRTPFLHMTDLYNTPGSADESAKKLEGNKMAQVLFEAQIAYSRGQIDKVYQQANYLMKEHPGFYAMIGSGMLMALCAIWRGDLEMWRKAKIHIADAPAKTDMDRDIVAMSITAVDSMLYDATNFPEWFKIGCFEPLHRDALPAAKVFYAKYMYMGAYSVAVKESQMEGIQGLSLMALVPLTIEPMVSQAVADRAIVAEIYLRMICAVVYQTSGNTAQAIRHLDRAITLALADGLYGILAEYGRTLGILLEQRLTAVDPEAWIKVKQLYKVYNEGWSKLSGSVRGKNLNTTLSPREREVAKLAAFGMQNSEIAEKLHMSLSGVKQAIRIVSEKTGMSRDQFAAVL